MNKEFRITYESCQLCPRRCKVNRLRGELGFCGMPGQLRAGRAALHFWEEPVLSGEHGAGAVFFSGCTLRCAYCQNYNLSTQRIGKEIRTEKLRTIFEGLIDQGAECIDLVTPTQFLPDILPALIPKLPVPVVYNCGGYERVETLQALEGLVDVYLPDLKYADPTLAERLSKATDYPEVAKAAIREMVRQTGSCIVEGGLLKRGVLIRHLVLPGEIDNTVKVLEWIEDTFSKGEVMVSLMAQYTPMGPAGTIPPYHRRITKDEYDTALSWLYLLGLDQGYTQGYEAASLLFVPEFDGTGL